MHMAYRASPPHILQEMRVCFSSCVEVETLFLNLELSKQNVAIFCSVLIGLELGFNIPTTDTRKLRLKSDSLKKNKNKKETYLQKAVLFYFSFYI